MRYYEAPLFTRHVYDYLTDEEYAAFQVWLADNPATGDLIPHGGGLRKVRWVSRGKGKRGGVRIIYYWWTKDESIYLVTIYKKGEVDDLTRDQLKVLRFMLKEDRK